MASTNKTEPLLRLYISVDDLFTASIEKRDNAQDDFYHQSTRTNPTTGYKFSYIEVDTQRLITDSAYKDRFKGFASNLITGLSAVPRLGNIYSDWKEAANYTELDLQNFIEFVDNYLPDETSENGNLTLTTGLDAGPIESFKSLPHSNVFFKVLPNKTIKESSAKNAAAYQACELKFEFAQYFEEPASQYKTQMLEFLKTFKSRMEKVWKDDTRNQISKKFGEEIASVYELADSFIKFEAYNTEQAKNHSTPLSPIRSQLVLTEGGRSLSQNEFNAWARTNTNIANLISPSQYSYIINGSERKDKQVRDTDIAVLKVTEQPLPWYLQTAKIAINTWQWAYLSPKILELQTNAVSEDFTFTSGSKSYEVSLYVEPFTPVITVTISDNTNQTTTISTVHNDPANPQNLTIIQDPTPITDLIVGTHSLKLSDEELNLLAKQLRDSQKSKANATMLQAAFDKTMIIDKK